MKKWMLYLVIMATICLSACAVTLGQEKTESNSQVGSLARAADGDDPRVVITRLDAAFQSNDKEALTECFIPELSEWYYALMPSERAKYDLNEISSRYPWIDYPHTKKNYWPQKPPLFFDCDRYYVKGDQAELDAYVNFFDESNQRTYAVMGFLTVNKVDGKWKIASFSTESALIHKYLGLKQYELSNSAVYVKKGDDEYFPVEMNPLSYGAWQNYALERTGLLPEGFNEEDIPTVEKGKHTLITTANVSSYKFYPVESSYYCFPYSLNQAMYASEGIVLSHGFLDYYSLCSSFCEVNGRSVVTIDDLNAACTGTGIWVEYIREDNFNGNHFLVSNQRTLLDVGYYAGTRYYTESLRIASRLYHYGEAVSCPVTRTKDGYFIVNTDALPVGLYVLKVGNNWTNDYLIRVAEPNSTSGGSNNPQRMEVLS